MSFLFFQILSLSSAAAGLSWFLSCLLITEAKCAEKSEVKGKLGSSAHHIFQSSKRSFVPPGGLIPHQTIWLKPVSLSKKPLLKRRVNFFCFVCLFDSSAPSATLDSFHSRHRVKRAICLFKAPPRACVCRSMQKLTQLERLDLGSNEFTEVVSISLPACLQGPGALFFLFFLINLIRVTSSSSSISTFFCLLILR